MLIHIYTQISLFLLSTRGEGIYEGVVMKPTPPPSPWNPNPLLRPSVLAGKMIQGERVAYTQLDILCSQVFEFINSYFLRIQLK